MKRGNIMLDRIIAFLTAIFAFIGSLLGLGGTKPEAKNYEVYENIRYSDASERNIMDIYIPEEALEREENGCILFIHGGSWTGGSKEEMADECIEAAGNGYIAATMSYTLYNDKNADTYSALKVLDEIGAAIQAVKDFTSDNGITVTKVATSGYSAGAHLSMLYAYSRFDESPLEIAFTANRVGPCDFSVEAWGSSGPGIAEMLAGKDICEEFADDEDAIIKIVSPSYYVTETSVPSLFGYGGRDTIVPAGNAKSIKAAFDAAGATYDYIIYPNSNHMLMLDPACAAEYSAKLFEYCELYF